MRHGDTVFDIETRTRILSQSGKKEVASVISFASPWVPDRLNIYHSPLQRATATAQIVRKHLKGKIIIQEKEELKPESSEVFMHSWIEEQCKNLLLVTHMPFINFLFHTLIFSKNNSVSQDILPFSCATLVCLAKFNDRWILKACVSPEMIR